MNIDAKKNDLTKDEILDILAKRKVSIKVYNTYDVTLQKDRWEDPLRPLECNQSCES